MIYISTLRVPDPEMIEIAAFASRLSYSHAKKQRSNIELLGTLRKAGDSHSKSLRGLVAYANINAPRFWWMEMVTYRVGVEQLGSESTMHSMHNKSDGEFRFAKETLPEGTMQKRIFMFSYQALSRIYSERKHHRLVEWQDFCEWIETLPFAKELITGEK